MIKIVKNQNILESDAEIITNAVNCVGVMGAGLAYQFKMAFPGMNKEYEKACENGLVDIGVCNYWFNKETKKYICNFPTKFHYSQPSKLSYIEDGMECLWRFVKMFGIKSVAIPKLGCGLGGLNWFEVKEAILNSSFKDYDGELIIYE